MAASEAVMGYLTVVFEHAVPLGDRLRLLATIGCPAMVDESEADAYCVEVPDNQQWQLAHRYAELEMPGGKPAISRVSWTRLRSDIGS